MAAASDDGIVYFKVPTGREVTRMPDQRDAIAFSKDEKYLGSASSDRTARMADPMVSRRSY
jgi:hypothetical protein